MTEMIAEALGFEERHESFIFIMKSIFQMDPLISKKSLYAVFGDEFLVRYILYRTGLSHVKLFKCHNHLLLNIDTTLNGSCKDFSKNLGARGCRNKSIL